MAINQCQKFHKYLLDPDFFLRHFPVSPDFHRLMMRVFHIDPAQRISIPDFRDTLRDMEVLIVTSNEARRLQWVHGHLRFLTPDSIRSRIERLHPDLEPLQLLSRTELRELGYSPRPTSLSLDGVVEPEDDDASISDVDRPWPDAPFESTLSSQSEETEELDMGFDSFYEEIRPSYFTPPFLASPCTTTDDYAMPHPSQQHPNSLIDILQDMRIDMERLSGVDRRSKHVVSPSSSLSTPDQSPISSSPSSSSWSSADSSLLLTPDMPPIADTVEIMMGDLSLTNQLVLPFQSLDVKPKSRLAMQPLTVFTTSIPIPKPKLNRCWDSEEDIEEDDDDEGTAMMVFGRMGPKSGPPSAFAPRPTIFDLPQTNNWSLDPQFHL